LNNTIEKIIESIVITQNPDGSAHIAPFGLRQRNNLVLIAPFRPSASLDNLLSGRPVSFNFTVDVRVFAGALTARRDWPVVKSPLGAWVLKSALSYQEVKLMHVIEDDFRPELYFETQSLVNISPFMGFNRAQAAVLELCVLVSRLNRLPIDKIDAEIKYLQIAINKTAGEHEMEAWKWLIDAVENHKSRLQGNNIA
jgi:uncharacterized protein